jgi:endonuclease/exonuclease/phosphatase family metal-dependent hydrolase
MTERPLYSENRLKSLVFGIYSMSSSIQIAPPSLAPPVLFLGASDSSLYCHRSRISAIVARMEEGLELLSDSLLLQPGVRDFLAGLPANSVDLTHLSTPRLLRWLIQSIQLISPHQGEELNRFCLSSLLEEEISVTTLNVWGVPLLLGGRCRERYRHIGRKLNARAADIVCLQEMWDRATRDIIEQAGYRSCFGEETMHGIPGGSGLCTLTNWDVVESQLLESAIRRGLERTVRKGALFTRLRSPSGDLIDVYNVHLASASAASPEDSVREARDLQITELRDWIEARRIYGSRVLIVGDFNVDASSSQYLRLAELGVDTFDASRRGSGDCPRSNTGFTFDPTINPWANSWISSPTRQPERLDYVLLDDRRRERDGSDRSEILSSVVFNQQTDQGYFLSDHFGVETIFRRYEL